MKKYSIEQQQQFNWFNHNFKCQCLFTLTSVSEKNTKQDCICTKCTHKKKREHKTVMTIYIYLLYKCMLLCHYINTFLVNQHDQQKKMRPQKWTQQQQHQQQWPTFYFTYFNKWNMYNKRSVWKLRVEVKTNTANCTEVLLVLCLGFNILNCANNNNTLACFSTGPR